MTESIKKIEKCMPWPKPAGLVDTANALGIDKLGSSECEWNDKMAEFLPPATCLSKTFIALRIAIW
jgi:hypothetical protein